MGEAIPKDQPLVHFISLGASCFPAAYLRKSGRRRYAGPFDWVFTSPEMIIHCLGDKFASFLDPGLCEDAGQVGRANHTIFSKMLQRATVFNHHDPRIPEHHAYLSRAVERFHRVLEAAATERKVFLLCSLDCRFHLDTGSLTELFRALSARTSSFELLVVRFKKPPTACDGDAIAAPSEGQLQETAVELALREETAEGLLRIYDMRLRGAHTGLFFEDAGDEAAFDQLLQLPEAWQLAPDPLAAAGPPAAVPRPGAAEEGAAAESFTSAVPLEVLRLPASALSPRLEPQEVHGCQLVLKEAVALRILRALGRKAGTDVSEVASEKCRRTVLPAGAAANELALLVVPGQQQDIVDEGAALRQCVAAFLRNGSCARAALVPESMAGGLQVDSQVAAVFGQRFPPGFDLFRVPDLSRPVAGGLRVEKAPPTSEPFVVVASPAALFASPGGRR